MPALKFNLLALTAFAAMAFSTHAAVAGYAVPADEADKLKACEKSICSVIVNKKAAGDLSCDVSKTWASSFIEDGIKGKSSVSWGLGDARCALKVSLSGDAIVKALTDADYVLEVPSQTASCDAETGSSTTSVKISLAPKLTFKGGKVTAVNLGVSEIDAPTVAKGVIWSALKVEETAGLFQAQLVDEINGFITEQCPDALK